MESNYWHFSRFGRAEEVMTQTRAPLPEPGAGQALVAIRAVGLNQAEIRYLAGQHFPPEHLPACIGHEAVGEIVALGSGASAWRVGDRVALLPMLVDMAGMGALRDRGLYDQSALLPVPDGYSDAEGAAYWMAIFTMAGALEMAGFGAQTCRDKSIVFTAATGGMGIVALKLLRGWGATVIATTRDDTKVSALGTFADHVALVRGSHELAPAMNSLVPEGVAAVIDPLGGTYVGASIDALGHGGHYVSYEMLAGNQGVYDIPTLMAKDAHLHGFTIFRLLRHPGLIGRLVTLGMEYAVEARPMVAGIFSFDEAPQAFEMLARGGHMGKIVVAIDY